MSEELSLAARHEQRGLDVVSVWDRPLVARYSKHAAECGFASEHVGLFDQSYRGVVDLRGDASLELLERITSNHPGDLVPDRGQLAALLTAKGRLCGGFQLFLQDEGYRLVLPDPVRPEFIKELQKYAFLSDVDVLPRDDVLVLALRGPKSDAVVEALGASPSADHLARTEVDVHGGITAVRISEKPLDTTQAGWDLWTTADAAAAVWDDLEAKVVAASGGPVGWEAAESLRVEAGFARWGFDYEDKSFPTEMGWDAALTFDKCYVGQEVVARMRTYGSDNKKLFRLLSDGRLESGAAVVDESGATVGRVTSVAQAIEGRAERVCGLGLVKRKAWESEQLALESGATVRLLPL